MMIIEMIIEMKSVYKGFDMGEGRLEVLKDVSLSVGASEMVAVVGQSGSGKTTLMNLLGCLDVACEGSYVLEGARVADLCDDELSDIRNRRIGFIFQTFNLIPRSTALRNVELPMLYAGLDPLARRERASRLLEQVGMGERMHHKPAQLSGGERQRVAIARALANDPAILLADEPTGSLDSSTGQMIMEIFYKLHRDELKTIILITHNEGLAAGCERVLTLHDGRVVD